MTSAAAPRRHGAAARCAGNPTDHPEADEAMIPAEAAHEVQLRTGLWPAALLEDTPMIRTDQFLISQRPFAVRLSSLTAEVTQYDDRIYLNGWVEAVWFRRVSGVIRACVGNLGLMRHLLPAAVDVKDPHAVLTADLDGRYGGDCHGRWDGERYWGAQEPDVAAAHLELLRPMLTNFPEIPEGYDGWWHF